MHLGKMPTLFGHDKKESIKFPLKNNWKGENREKINTPWRSAFNSFFPSPFLHRWERVWRHTAQSSLDYYRCVTMETPSQFFIILICDYFLLLYRSFLYALLLVFWKRFFTVPPFFFKWPKSHQCHFDFIPLPTSFIIILLLTALLYFFSFSLFFYLTNFWWASLIVWYYA